MKMIFSAKRKSKGQTPTCGVKNGKNLWNFSSVLPYAQAKKGFFRRFLAILVVMKRKPRQESPANSPPDIHALFRRCLHWGFKRCNALVK